MTTARPSIQEDRRRRVIQYLLAMGFRIVAFPLAIWALMSGWTITGWILAGVAILAPSVAVGLANNVDHRQQAGRLPPPPRPALGPGESENPEAPGAPR